MPTRPHGSQKCANAWKACSRAPRRKLRRRPRTKRHRSSGRPPPQNRRASAAAPARRAGRRRNRRAVTKAQDAEPFTRREVRGGRDVVQERRRNDDNIPGLVNFASDPRTFAAGGAVVALSFVLYATRPLGRNRRAGEGAPPATPRRWAAGSTIVASDTRRPTGRGEALCGLRLNQNVRENGSGCRVQAEGRPELAQLPVDLDSREVLGLVELRSPRRCRPRRAGSARPCSACASTASTRKTRRRAALKQDARPAPSDTVQVGRQRVCWHIGSHV